MLGGDDREDRQWVAKTQYAERAQRGMAFASRESAGPQASIRLVQQCLAYSRLGGVIKHCDGNGSNDLVGIRAGSLSYGKTPEGHLARAIVCECLLYMG